MKLSDRCIEVLKVVAQTGKLDLAAKQLYLERCTVVTHVKKARKALQAKTTLQAVYIAAKRGLI